MAVSSVLGPDGKTYTLEHPEGASQEDIFKFVHESTQREITQPKPGVVSNLVRGGLAGASELGYDALQFVTDSVINKGALKAETDLLKYAQYYEPEVLEEQLSSIDPARRELLSKSQSIIGDTGRMSGEAFGVDEGRMSADIGRGFGQIVGQVATAGLAAVPMAYMESRRDAEQTFGVPYSEMTKEQQSKTDIAGGTYSMFSLALNRVGLRGMGLNKLDDFFQGTAKVKGSVVKEAFKGGLKGGGVEFATETTEAAAMDQAFSRIYDDNREFSFNDINDYLYEGFIGSVVGGTVGTGTSTVKALAGPTGAADAKTQKSDLGKPVAERSAIEVPRSIEVTYQPVDGNPTTIILHPEKGEDAFTAAERILEGRRLPDSDMTVNEVIEQTPLEVSFDEQEADILKEDVLVDPVPVEPVPVQPVPVEPTPDQTPEQAPEPAPEGTETPISSQRDYRNVKVGDTFEIVGVNGKTKQVEAIGISDESGVIRFKREDGSIGITGNEVDSQFSDVNSPDYVLQSSATGQGTRGKSIKKLFNDELDALERGINKRLEEVPGLSSGAEQAGRENISDLNAIKLERRRRSQAPVDPVPVEQAPTPTPEPTPAPEPSVETAPESEVDTSTGLPSFSLPQNLKKGQPGYQKTQNVKFASDLERAAYSATTTPRDETAKRKRAKYRKILQDANYSSTEINTMGREVRSQMRDQYKGPDSELSVTLPQDIVAQAAPLTSEQGSVNLTQNERKFFNSFLENQANREELLEEVPSLRISEGKLSIAPQDIDNFSNFVTAVGVSDGLGTVPPRLKTSQFYQPFLKSGAEDIVAQAAPLETIDFIKGASGDPVQNLASKKRRRAGTGEGKNPSLRLEVNGLPIYIGKDSAGGGKSFEGWTEETSAWFTDQEINNAAGWYDSLKSKFTKEFGPDRGPKMMLAWLASQQNESPAGGVRNTFRVIDRLAGIKSGKKGGLADEKLEAIFTDTLADKGLDAKLSDFIDAGMGKRTRTFMGDDADGGMPFVADVHTGRDSGKLDQQTLTRIKRFADSGVLTVDGQPASVEITKVKKKTIKGKTKTEPEEAILRVGGQEVKLVRDLTGSPSKGEYEGISDWGNRLTDYLNSIGWKGRTDWIPAEVQAVGWMRTLRQYGLKESDLESSLIENTFRVAAEVDYGLGSKITQIYPDFQKLNEQQKTEITEDVLGFIVPRVQQEMAPSAILRDSEFGIGSWEGSVSPSGNFYVMGSDEAANIFTNSLAWVTEQAGTMRAVIGKGGKNQRAVALVGLSNNELSTFVDFVNQIQRGADKKASKDAEALRGFSTRAMPGEQGIVVFGLTESKAKGVKNTLQKFAEQYTGSDSLTIQNFSAVTTFTENNWKENQNGESYIQEIEQSGSTGNIRERLLRLRQQYGQRLAETGQRIAPEVFGETSIQSRVDQFVEAGKEYLEGAGTDITAQAAETAVEDLGPQDTFDNINQLESFVSKSFNAISDKLGIAIRPNMLGQFVAQYNVTQKIIEYNPRALLNRTKAGVQAAMREEIIHAAMHNVLIQKEKKAKTGRSEDALWVDFFTALGNNLTPQERTEIQNVYQSLQEGNAVAFGSEYSRAVVQKFRYGDFTEQYMAVDKGGPAFQAIVDILRSVQAYMAKVLGPMVKTDPEAAQVIVDTVELLNAIDPSIRPKSQNVVANAYNATDKNTVEENAEEDVAPKDASQRVREERKWWDGKIRSSLSKSLTPIITRLRRINPQFGLLFQRLENTIRERNFKYKKKAQPFFNKLNSLKGNEFSELKQLLFFSPTPAEADLPQNKATIQRRDALLHKHGLLNMYRLDVQPILEEIYAEYSELGMPIGYLEDYFPRVVKDLEGLIKSYGHETKRTFGNLVRDENARRKKDGLPEMESSERSRFFQDFLQNKSSFGPKGVRPPGNVKVREIQTIKPSKLQFYEDPSISFGSYTVSMVSAIEAYKVLGSTNKAGNKGETGKLGELTEQLFQEGKIDEQDANELKSLSELATIQAGQELEILKFAGQGTYAATLIDVGTVLVQFLDLAKVLVLRGPSATAQGLYRTVTGNRVFDIEKDFSIMKEQIMAEYDDAGATQRILNFGLRYIVPFQQMDVAMKHTSVEATFVDYLKKANSPVGSKKYQQLMTELTIRMGPDAAFKAVQGLQKKTFDKNSPEVKEALMMELFDRQPLTYLQIPETHRRNPNSRLLYKLKTFMILDINFNRQLALNDLMGPSKTIKQRYKGLKMLVAMMAALTAIGVPKDLLLDFIRGKDTYLADHVVNNILNIFGLSRYGVGTIFKDGPVDAIVDRFKPAAYSIVDGTENDVLAWVNGDREISEFKVWKNAPVFDIWGRYTDDFQEKKEKLYKEKRKEGQVPFIRR